MRLHDYLKLYKIKDKDFAAEMGITMSYLSLLRHHKRWPPKDLMDRIRVATNHEVTADSFLERIEDEIRV